MIRTQIDNHVFENYLKRIIDIFRLIFDVIFFFETMIIFLLFLVFNIILINADKCSWDVSFIICHENMIVLKNQMDLPMCSIQLFVKIVLY